MWAVKLIGTKKIILELHLPEMQQFFADINFFRVHSKSADHETWIILDDKKVGLDIFGFVNDLILPIQIFFQRLTSNSFILLSSGARFL